MFWLGIDIGTGGSRALLIDDQGRVLHCVHRAARRDAHGAAHVGRAASRGLVGRLAGCHSRRPRRGEGHRQGRARHRPLRPDARTDAARRGRQRHPSGSHLVRSAQPGAGGLDQCQRRRANDARLHRQSGPDRLHTAETAVGPRQRAGTVRPHRSVSCCPRTTYGSS